MDNSQILEEIDIIVRAKIDKAKKDIDKVKNEVEKMSQTLTKEFEKIDKSGQLNNFSKKLQKSKDDMESFGEEVRKIKITDENGTSFFDYKKEKKKLDEVAKEVEKIRNIKVNVDGLSFSYNPDIPNDYDTQYNKAAINQENIESQQDEVVIRPKIDDEFVKQWKEEWTNYFANQDEFKIDLNVNDKILDRMIGKVKSAKQEFENINNVNIKEKIGKAIENVATKTQKLKTQFSEAKEKIGSVADKISKPISKIKSFASSVKDGLSHLKKFKKTELGIGDTLSKGISKGINSIKKFAMGLLSVRSAYTVLSRAASAYLSFDTQLSNSIQNSWNVLGSLLAPMLEYVANLFYKLVSAVATFVKSLTCIDLVARANTKALEKQNKALEKSNQLSEIDDINNLTTTDTGAGASSTITADDINLPIFEKLKKEIQEIITLIKKGNFAGLGKKISSSIIKGLNTLSTWIKNIDVSPIADNISDFLTNIDFSGILVGLVDVFGESILKFQDLFLNIDWETTMANFSTGLANAIGRIGEYLDRIEWGELGTKVSNILLSINWEELGLKVQDAVLKGIKGLGEFFSNVEWGELVESLSRALKRWLSEAYKKLDEIDWYETGKKVGETLIEILQKVDWLGIALELLKLLGKALLLGIELLGGLFVGIIEKLFSNSSEDANVDEDGKKLGTKIIDGIKTSIAEKISGVWDTIKNSEFYKKMMALGTTIKTALTQGLNGLRFDSIFKNAMNGGISIVNKAVDWINSKLRFSWDDFEIAGQTIFKGGSIQLARIPHVPLLATGNVATEPTVGIFGEYANAKNDPEVTSPISMMKGAFRDVLNEIDLGGTRIDTLRVDLFGKAILNELIDHINDKYKRNGVSVLKEA